MNSQRRFMKPSKNHFGAIQVIDGFEINWRSFNVSREDVNVDVFCKHGASIYNDEFLEKTKPLLFFSTTTENINKYKISCEPCGKTLSTMALNRFVNRLWKDRRYDTIYKLFKQVKSLQSVILLDKPKDEHLTARISDEFLKEIMIDPTKKNPRDKTVSFPCLKYDENLWLNISLAFFPTFDLTPDFFTFDVLRTLLVIWQHSILTCFQDLYNKYISESSQDNSKDNSKDNSEKNEERIDVINKIKKAKQEYVYDKGLAIAKQIFNLFCKKPEGWVDKEGTPGLEFSICYIESLEQYDRKPGENGWIMKRLYHEQSKHRMIKHWEDIEIELILSPTEEIMKSPEFNLLVATLIPYHNKITWDPYLKKCDRVNSTKQDFINLFKEKLTDSDRQRIIDFKNGKDVSISDIILRTFRIRSLMNNEVFIHNKSFKDYFIENVYTASYLQTVKSFSRVSIFDSLFASDSITPGTRYANIFINEYSEKTSTLKMILELVDRKKLFNTIVSVMLTTNDFRKSCINVNNNIFKTYGKEGFTEFINNLVSYGDDVLKLGQSYLNKFSDLNQTKYCELIAAMTYVKGFSVKTVESILFESSFEERIHVIFKMIEYKKYDENNYKKLSTMFEKSLSGIDKKLITRSAEYTLQDIMEAIN